MAQRAIDSFERIAGTPAHWQWSAREFICAANILYQQYCAMTESLTVPLRVIASAEIPQSVLACCESITPMMLLYGYALENMTKALLIAQGIKATVKGNFNKADLKGHKIKKLIGRTTVTLTNTENDLMDELEITITHGKYPVGLTAQSLEPSRPFILPTDIEIIHKVFNDLENELYKVEPNRTLPPVNATLFRYSLMNSLP